MRSAVIVATMLLAAGCSGATDTASLPTSTSTSVAPDSAASDKVTGDQADSGDGEASFTDTASTTTTSGTPASGSRGTTDDSLPTNITLDARCAVRGSPTHGQGFEAEVGGGNIVIYSTEYADGSNEGSNPEYKTGFGSARAGPDGVARAAWIVPSSAPVGVATLHVGGSAEMRPRTLDFEVAATTAGCS